MEVINTGGWGLELHIKYAYNCRGSGAWPLTKVQKGQSVVGFLFFLRHEGARCEYSKEALSPAAMPRSLCCTLYLLIIIKCP